MPFSAKESIRQRLESARRRQNLSLTLSQLGRWLAAISLLFASVVAVGILFGFSNSAWRVAFLAWAAGVFALSFIFLWQLLSRWQSHRRFVHKLEQQLPDLEQRLITSVEFEGRNAEGVSPQLLDRLLQDAQLRVQDRPMRAAVSFRPAQRSLAMAGLAFAVLAGLFLFSNSFLQGTRELAGAWGSSGQPAVAAMPISIKVDPGNTSMQRGDDVTVTASLDNARSDQLVLYVQDDRVNWQRVTMNPERGQAEGSAQVFASELRQLSQDLVYYVEYRPPGADDDEVVRSPQFSISLFDLPRVEGLELAYAFPDYTGLPERIENPGGDVVAPEGTTINVAANLNKAVKSARLVFESGESIDLAVQDRQLTGSFQVSEDDHYRIELLDYDDHQNKNPTDYYIRAVKDREPQITLRTPGKDQRVMPLEEVAFEIQAEDDYGLTQFELNYSVVGVGDKKIDFLEQADNRKTVSGSTLVYLEDLEVQPGDIVSYSVAVKDNNGLQGPTEVVSDIYFLEVIPTDHQFSRGRSGGGGGGGGGGNADSSALVTTQKDVIAATWKLRNRQNKVDEESFARDGRIILESQAEVAQRAQMSINRLTERGNYAQDNYQRAVDALQKAISEMESAIDSLDELALAEALASEQRALQAILQAESQVNRTEVAMNRGGGGGGGGGGQEREDLRELFEMEMGELENRYEMPQQQSGQNAQQQNETLDKLKELARRQERLTRAQRELARRENQMEEEQRRRQLEQLRREQEELQRQLAQLSESMQQQSGQQSSQNQNSRSSGQGGSQSQQNQGQQDQRQQAQQLQRALEQMQEAAQSESPSQAAAKSQKALDSLRQQAEQMDADGRRSLAELQQAIKERSEELVQQQRQLRRNVEEKSRNQSLSNTRSQTINSGETEELQQQQAELRENLDELGRELREIASRGGDEAQRQVQEAHDISRSLRPIQDKMDTSQQILRRGMLNLSLKLEGDIEEELASLQRRIQGMGGAPGAPGGDQDSEQVANQVQQLRESLEELQRQLEASGSAQQPDQLAQRQGERSGSGQQDADRQSRDAQDGQTASREDMQRSLQRSRELAQGLSQLGAGGQPWSGSARSIRSQLTRQDLEEFLSRPELLQELLAPVVELENELRLQAELKEISDRLYSVSDEDVPEQYKSLVESYYRVLSESKGSGNTAR